MSYKAQIIILSSVLLVVFLILLLIISPDFLVAVIAGLVASLIWVYINFFNPKKLLTHSIKIYGDRDRIEPPFGERFLSAKRSIFLVGFSFETTIKDHGEFIKKALVSKKNLKVKILMLHPNSLHVSAHQPFSTDRNIKENIIEVVNKRLKSLFDDLDPSAKKRIKARATFYLPRFAARIIDDEIMLLNLYLYDSKAHVNPVIELRRESFEDEFLKILNSLDKMFRIGDDGKTNNPNHNIIDDGIWYGLPN